MTARRSSATERRGIGGFTPRPAALSVGVLAIALAATGCASRNANTAGMASPLNQDTAAIARDGGLPHPPAAAPQAALAANNTVTALPSATVVVPPPGTTTVVDTGGNLADQIVLKLVPGAFTIGLTPRANPAAPKPALEVVGMPTWLWIEGVPPALQTTVTVAGVVNTVIDQAVIDQVDWSTDKGSLFRCGGGTPTPPTTPATTPPVTPTTTYPTPSPGLGYGIPYDLGFNPTASGQPNACVNTFSSPYYTKANGKTQDGVYALTAKVYWHISCTRIDTNGVATTVVLPKSYTGNLLTPSTPIRVGEIQALATSP
ncbi:hypothetical protein GCM10009839_14860 [Catenulispora yoronensis]|uniref:Uncharacterized protein n=1 Tax=Catenulispora yoronensis TaxID=450799 RepID=A0ABN2TSH0_9ACTN